MEIRILRGWTRAKSRITTLAIRSTDFGLFPLINRDKREVLHLRRNNLMQHCLLGPTGWKTVLQKKTWRIWWKRSRSQKCALMTKQAKESLAAIRSAASKWREVILPWYSSVSSAGLLSTREKWSYWRGPSEELQRWLRDWSTFHMKADWESWDCLAWRRVGPAGGQSLTVCSRDQILAPILFNIFINDVGDGGGLILIRFDTKPGEMIVIY